MPDPTPFDIAENEALAASQAAYNDASDRYNDGAARLDAMRNIVPPDDPKLNAQYVAQLQTIQTGFDTARAELARAAQNHATLLGRMATARGNMARKETDPRKADLWAQQALDASAHAQLAQAQAGLYAAKTQSEMESWSQKAQAALQNAQSRASRVTSQNDRDESAALLAQNKAAAVPALTQSTIALHNQTIQTAAAHASLYVAQTARAQAQADVLIPAQADYYVQRGILTQAQSEQLKLIGPIKAEEIEAKLGVDKARADLIRSQIGKYQLAPAQDRNLPTLTTFRPSTGEVAGVANPSYVNPYLQPLTDRAAAIDAIRNDLAAGKYGTGQQALDYANQLVEGLNQQSIAQAQGYTVPQYQDAIQRQAEFGKSILGGMQSQGDSMANTLLSYASKARGLGGFSPTPYQNAIGMGGGEAVVNQALSLMRQLKPITSRSDAYGQMQVLSQLSDIAKRNAGSGTAGTAQAPTQTPAQQSDQVASSPIAASMASQAQDSGGAPGTSLPRDMPPAALALLQGAGLPPPERGLR